MMPRDPVLGCLYGPQKVGKTSCLGYGFPYAIWIAAPGATAPLESVCGYAPMIPPIDISDVDEAIAMLNDLALPKNAKRREQVDALIFDDLNLYIERMILDLKRKGIDERNKYAVWDAIRTRIIDLRDSGRRAKIHVFVNAHEQPPRMRNGARLRGGPNLPGEGSELITAGCDIVYRAVPNANVPIGWKCEIRCSVEDQDYVSGDRHNATPDHAPMNLGEILRVQGFKIRRHPDMPWQEAIVEEAAAFLVSAQFEAETTRAVLAKVFEAAIAKQGGIGTTREERNVRERRAIWTQRDAYDRAILRNAQSAHRRRLYG